MKKAMKMPRAKKAVDSEWSSLAESGAWDLKSVRPRRQVIDEAKKTGKTVHFGSLMDLCHEKNSELHLPESQKVYKGRVVFRGDQVKDENGFYAVFTEQSASASHMAAAKYLDAIGRFPGNVTEDSDAVKAYRQVFLDDLEDLLGNSKEIQAQTWISLPRSRRPTWWDDIEDPVCLLKRNLYGHSIAGLI